MGKTDRIKEFEEELSKTKYNKRTQAAIGLLKAKIARLRDESEHHAKKGPKFHGYAVSKTGDATVVLLGFPSVGKSTLLNAITNAKSEVADYQFTTLNVIPGLLEYKDAKIQILDVPGIVEGAARGSGRGREVLSVIRNANMVIMLIDALHPEHLEKIEKEVYLSGLRINQKKPDVRIRKTIKGGIDIGLTAPLIGMDKNTVKKILCEFRISNAQIVIRDSITPDQLIDVIANNRIYLPAITAVNKIDLIAQEQVDQIDADIFISADSGRNLPELKQLIYKRLNFIRIYTKEQGKKADMDEPLIMRKGDTVDRVCRKLHKDFVKKFKYAKVWGRSAKFPGQKHGLNHKMKDGDIVEVHID